MGSGTVVAVIRLLEELDRDSLRPEIEVSERAVGLDHRAPYRLRVLVVVGFETGRRADAEAEITQAFEVSDQRVGRERPLVLVEAGDEDARRDVAFERREVGLATIGRDQLVVL